MGLGHSWFDDQLRRCHDLLSNSTLASKMRVLRRQRSETEKLQ